MRQLFIGISMLFLFVSLVQLNAQETLVVGHVRNKADKSPISAVNIYFNGTENGVQSDEEGFYVIRNNGAESKLIFSCIGYKTQEVTIVPGQTAGLEIALREDVHILQELFVLPGTNPTDDLMRRVKREKSKNDVYNLPLTISCNEQSLVLMSKVSNYKSAFRQLSNGLISYKDTSQFLPLYVKDEKYLIQSKLPRKNISEDFNETPKNAAILVEKLIRNMKPNLNFYNNNIAFFGKYFVSPLSSAGSSYYRFYLIDSIMNNQRKQYYVRFRSKNYKNLAFNGELWIDSASNALSKINLELPASANINYITNLKITKTYKQAENKLWYPEDEKISYQMTYNLLADSLHLSPEIFIRNKITSSPVRGADFDTNEYFADSEYTKDALELKMTELKELPLMKTAYWIADAILTGYMQVGKIDVGKVYQLARITDQEGFRFSIPIRTNELLSKHFSVGGYLGYGVRDKSHPYSFTAEFKMPFEKKSILSVGYTDDLRRIDYDYNDYLLRENPLISGDEDIGNTIVSFQSTDKVNHRKEFFTSLAFDWNKNIESNLFFRKNKYYGNTVLPFHHNGFDLLNMTHEYISFNTRFSLDESTYEDHFQRIYIQNTHPVYYITLETGRTQIGEKENFYGKVIGKVKQQMLFDFGQWNYSFDASIIVGTVPYNLLLIPSGTKSLLFNQYHFNMLNYMEFAYDNYIAMHHEWIFNGIILNKIPLINMLNLREMVTLKSMYGRLNEKHVELLDFPSSTTQLKVPYFEVGVGFTNIFRIFSLQIISRSDLNRPFFKSWAVISGIRFSF